MFSLNRIDHIGSTRSENGVLGLRIEQEKKREEEAGKGSYLSDFLQAKPVWTLEDSENTCLAANDKENEIAVGSSAGHVTVYNTSDWFTKCVLAPPTGNKVLTLHTIWLHQNWTKSSYW